MNKEFIYLNNEEVAVTDDYGKITVRDAESNMRNILVAEDKLNALNDTIDRLDVNVKEEMALIELIDKWYKVIGVSDIAMLVAAPIGLGLASGLGLATFWFVATGAACGFGLYTQTQSTKKINGYNSKMQKAISLKQQTEQDLDNFRALNEDYEVSNAMVGDIVKVNSEKALENQDKKLRRAYNKGYKEKVKTLVKTRTTLR